MKTILVDAVNTAILKTPEGGYVQFKELFDLLETYPNPKIMVTNADDTQLETFGLTSVPYVVFTMKHAPDKLDPQYFKTLLETYAFQPADVVYFEHNPDAVASAQSVGITTYHYNKETKDLVGLKQFLDTSLV